MYFSGCVQIFFKRLAAIKQLNKYFSQMPHVLQVETF
jgi:hypothetical protein